MGIKKEYSKPSMFLESFQPQEYCDVCIFEIIGIDPNSNVRIPNSSKVWIDSNQDHLINGTDFLVGSTAEHNTDGSNGWGNVDTYKLVWWASSEDIASTIYNSSNQSTEFLSQQKNGHAGYVEAVLKKGGSGHYLAGQVVAHMNHS